MSFETDKDKLRIVVPRGSRLRRTPTGSIGADRDRDHGSDGRFREGNRAATGTGPRRLVRGFVPVRGRRLFDAIMTAFGTPAHPSVAMYVGQQVRHELAAADLHAKAVEAGLETEKGRALDERSIRHAELATRASVAALDAARVTKQLAGPSDTVSAMRARAAARAETSEADRG